MTDRKDAQLASVIAAHAGDPETTDALASALDDYAALAAPPPKRWTVSAGSTRLVKEAAALATELRARPASPAQLAPAARAALDLRNRVISLLWDRMSLVRSAARFVFRTNPEIAREATSAYERRRRAANRRGSTQGPIAAPNGAEPAPGSTPTS